MYLDASGALRRSCRGQKKHTHKNKRRARVPAAEAAAVVPGPQLVHRLMLHRLGGALFLAGPAGKGQLKGI